MAGTCREITDSVKLTVTIREHGGWGVVAVDGEVDFATEAQLSASFAEATAATPWLIVDCGPLGFCDSSFLKVLVNVHNEVRAAGGNLVVAAAPGHLERFLDRTGLNRVISVQPSVAEVTG